MVRLKYWVTDGEIYEALIDLADYDPGNDLALVPGAGNGDTPTLRRKTLRKSRHRLTDTKFWSGGPLVALVTARRTL